MSINIVHLVNSFQLAGAERIAFNLAKNLDQNLYHPYLIAIVPPQGHEQERGLQEIISSNIEYYDLGKKPHKKSPATIALLVRLLRSLEIDIIHTHGLSADTYGRIAAYLAGTPIRLVTIHSQVVWESNPLLGKIIERILSKYTTRYVAVAKSVRDSASKQFKINKEKIEVVFNGIDVTKFSDMSIDRGAALKKLGINSSIPIILCVGRLARPKGQDLLLEAGALLAADGNPIQIVLAGDGPIRSTLEDQALSSGISVCFLGWRDDIENIYPIADLAVIPSRWEGHPIVLLEAMAAGIPIIATEVSSIPEMIISNENGLLVPPSNSKALAEAIKHLVTNQELQVKLREAALITMNNFTLSRMVAGYEKVYQACMK